MHVSACSSVLVADALFPSPLTVVMQRPITRRCCLQPSRRGGEVANRQCAKLRTWLGLVVEAMMDRVRWASCGGAWVCAGGLRGVAVEGRAAEARPRSPQRGVEIGAGPSLTELGLGHDSVYPSPLGGDGARYCGPRGIGLPTIAQIRTLFEVEPDTPDF